jgi:hypothetical protein
VPACPPLPGASCAPPSDCAAPPLQAGAAATAISTTAPNPIEISLARIISLALIISLAA